MKQGSLGRKGYRPRKFVLVKTGQNQVQYKCPPPKERKQEGAGGEKLPVKEYSPSAATTEEEKEEKKGAGQREAEIKYGI
jgi:hypothetical protein